MKKTLDRIGKEMQRWINLLFGRGGGHRDRYGPGVVPHEADADETTAVALIRANTHENYHGDFGRLRHRIIQGTEVINGWPVIQGGVGGYYIQNREEEWTCHDNGRIIRKVRVHECAHHKEHKMRLIPPWHYPPWARLFVGWRNVTAQSVPGIMHIIRRPPREILCDSLPGVQRGDRVEVDTVQGQQFDCKCTGKGIEIVQ